MTNAENIMARSAIKQRKTLTPEIRALTCALLLGGLIGIADPWLTGGLPWRSALGVLGGVTFLSLIPYLHWTKNIRVTMLAATSMGSIVFLGYFGLIGDPYLVALGFAVPVTAAMFMPTFDAVIVVAGYCLASAAIGLGIQFDVWSPPLAAVRNAEQVGNETIKAVLIIGAIAGTAIWKERLLGITSRRFEAVVEHGFGVIIEADSKGHITYIRGNRLLDGLGYDQDDLLGRHQLEFLSPEGRRTTLGMVPNSNGNYLYDEEIKVLTKNGLPRWVRMSGGTYLDADGRYRWLHAIQDIHETVLHRESVQEMSRLESLGNVCGGLAHDFNNLLTVIGIHGEMIDEDSIRAEILDAQQQAAAVTEGLLTFARRQEFEEQDVCVSEFLAQSQSLIRRLLPATIHCNWHIETDDYQIKIDPAQLQQLLMNLVTNAEYAMPHGGEFTVGATTTDVLPDSILDEGVRAGPYLALTIADTGIGMKEETLSRAVEPFFTTKPRGKGTGLGLAIAHGVIQRAGGAMQIESRAGYGTTIHIYLPTYRSHNPGAGSESVDELDGLPSNWTDASVLVVEDRKEVASAVRSMLQQAGFAVQVVSDAETGRLLLKQHAFELLISDIMLPGVSGVELLEEALECYPGIRGVLISGSLHQPIKVIDANPEATRFLAKPFSRSELLTTVRELTTATSDC